MYIEKPLICFKNMDQTMKQGSQNFQIGAEPIIDGFGSKRTVWFG